MFCDSQYHSPSSLPYLTAFLLFSAFIYFSSISFSSPICLSSLPVFSGHYIYLEASSPTQQGDKAQIESGSLAATTSTCMMVFLVPHERIWDPAHWTSTWWKTQERSDCSSIVQDTRVTSTFIGAIYLFSLLTYTRWTELLKFVLLLVPGGKCKPKC